MSYKCKGCGGENVIRVKYHYSHPEIYDGISEISCNDCKKNYGRWTGEEIKEGYCESRYGDKGVIKMKKYNS